MSLFEYVVLAGARGHAALLLFDYTTYVSYISCTRASKNEKHARAVHGISLEFDTRCDVHVSNMY